jgi:hypothetical protein
MHSALDFLSFQLLGFCLERKSKTRRLEISAFKIVSLLRSILSEGEVTHVPLERLALKWVQTYIEEFGGDPKKVTM